MFCSSRRSILPKSVFFCCVRLSYPWIPSVGGPSGQESHRLRLTPLPRFGHSQKQVESAICNPTPIMCIESDLDSTLSTLPAALPRVRVCRENHRKRSMMNASCKSEKRNGRRQQASLNSMSSGSKRLAAIAPARGICI